MSAKQSKITESRGFHTYNRIGRPVVVFDQRSKFTLSGSEFDKAMAERKSIKIDEVTEVICDVEVEHV